MHTIARLLMVPSKLKTNCPRSIATTIVAAIKVRARRPSVWGLVFSSLFLLNYSLGTPIYAQDPAGPSSQWRLTTGQAGIASQGQTPFKPTTGQLVANLVGPVAFGEKAPHALVFDGDSKAAHRVVVSPNVDRTKLPTQNLTVEAWVLIDKPLEWGGIVGCMQDNGSYERGWLLGYRNSRFNFGLSSKSTKRLTYLTSSKSFEHGFWYHVVATYDGKQMTLFVDGQIVATSADQSGEIAYPDANKKAPLIIGAYEDDNERHCLDGQIEQVSIWKRNLTTAEVRRQFENRKTQFPEIEAIRPDVVDWPTWNRDNQRTGATESGLTFPLKQQWVHHQQYAPQPAWPKPANQDFWHKKFHLKARVVYDSANHVVTVGDRIYFGSSADGAVHCLNSKTGQPIWKFSTEGPVRLAPTIADGLVLFGSDDGHVYCVNADDGTLKWRLQAGPIDRRIPGNERVISVWPVRTGVLVEDDIGFFCAGLFPQQGVYQAAVNIHTGKKLASNKVEMSAQGYLERRAGKLFVATGRDPAGAFVAGLKRRGKGVGKSVAAIPDEFRYAFITAGKSKIGGGDGSVAAFGENDGQQIWTAPVEGKAWSLAMAGDRLYVSTDTGAIYCFGSDGTPSKTVDQRMAKLQPKIEIEDSAVTRATRIVELTRVNKGYCLITDCQSADLAIALSATTELQIVARTGNAETATKLRTAIANHSLANRIAVHVGEDSLPYTDYMFNLVLADNIGDEDQPMTADTKRIVRPISGIVLSSLTVGGVHIRPSLDGTGEWTHMYANAGNTVCSQDTQVTGPFDIQWFGRPGPQQMVDRHHRTVAPVWANGRLFIPGDNRVIAADAYNGTPLWNVAVPNSRRAGAYRDSSYLVAGPDSVFVAAGGKCLVLDAETGQQKRVLTPPDQIEKQPREWGFLSADNGQVFGSTTKPGGIRRDHSLLAINEGTFWDFRPLVCSDRFFAVDEKTGQNTWEYRPTSGMLINASFSISDKYVFFVESTNPKTNDVINGRIDPRELMGKGSKVIALHRDSGSIAWSNELDLTKVQHNVHCAVHDGKLVVVGSYNSGTNKKTDNVMYQISVLKADSGKVVWEKTQRQETTIGGDHGEQDHHPVVVGNRLYCEPYAYDLHNGKPLAFGWDKKHRRGCGTISASASTFFFRQSNPTMFDLESNSYSKVTSATRPGCWINMIPAGGLLLIPEASSGCTCNYAVQTSLAFLPRKSAKEQPDAW